MFAVASCATYPDQENPKIPAELEPLLMDCGKGDGALALKAFGGDDLIGTGEVEWISEDSKWTAMMLNPLGQSMLTFKYADGGLSSAGPIAEELPEIVVRDDGFLEIKSYFVAIRADEFPCLLAGRVPSAWRSSLKAVVEKEDKHRMWFDDDMRVVKVVAAKKKNKLARHCTLIKWGSFFAERKLMYCQDIDGEQQGRIVGLGDYRLEWQQL